MYNSCNTTLKVYIIVLMLMNSTTVFYHFYRLKPVIIFHTFLFPHVK